MFVCVFGVFQPTREFFTQLETSPLPVKGYKFDLHSELMAIEQWGFLYVPHLVLHGSTLYIFLYYVITTLRAIYDKRNVVDWDFLHLIWFLLHSNVQKVMFWIMK